MWASQLNRFIQIDFVDEFFLKPESLLHDWEK